MRRGSTPTVTIAVENVDLNKVDNIQITLKQDNVLIVKNSTDISIDKDNKIIGFSLTQKETLSLSVNIVQIQCKFKIGEVVIVSDISKVPVDDVLNEEEI